MAKFQEFVTAKRA